MPNDAARLVEAVEEAAHRPAVMLSGIAIALRLLVAWVKSVEARLSQLEKDHHGA